MRTILFTLMSLATAAASAATVYKWVDDNGVTHYSDQPHENAEKVQLKAPQTYTAPKPQRTRAPAAPPARTEEGPTYSSCAFSEPANDQMFMNTTTVTAGVSLQPQLRPGDQLTVTLDGQRVPGVPADGGQFTISPVDRGTHSLQLVIQDGDGKPLCQSASVTFHVHQTSVLNPANPGNPGSPLRH